ncbi:DUF1772 domain-containing protein [Telmatospirillum sp. J64-1]|uniref:anthrone oxygenase family protein n=1 Tax=Telmatospirillum sp. J64-1 TaxID=2502183 RepID=UPI00115DB7A7|nr:anthrone oxygenase family protein [Telmatospirillum sp. J64-1]
MTDDVTFILLIMAATGTGLVGGIFFAFSNFVMRGLARLPVESGAAAMQSINVTVLNPLFFTAFFGSGILCLLLGIAALASPGEASSLAALAAMLLYLGGSIGVTVFFNVPLNKRLARLPPSDPRLEAEWTHYLAAWTKWNHARTVAALAAAALLTFAAGQ